MAQLNNYDYDVLIIGSGPGGYVAAIRAAQLGQRVAIVEKDAVGGVCLNIGCIPTKAIIHQAEIYNSRFKLAAMGVNVVDSKFNYESVFNISRSTAETLSKGVSYLLKKHGVTVITGAAKLITEHEASVSGERGGDERKISAKAIIVATGSRPKEILGLEFDGSTVLSSNDALMLHELPRRALIVGGGAIGVEFAHIWNAFGSEVHIVEMAERILPSIDGEASAALARSFNKRGIKIYTAATVASYSVTGDYVSAVIGSATKTQTAISVDKIFVMTGRAPCSENIGLEGAGIATSNGFIKVGDYYQTNVPSVYAIGDVALSARPSPLLAHAASAAGEIAAEHIAGHKPRCAYIDPSAVPNVVYSEPQVASFGLTEEQALACDMSFDKASFPFRGCGKAVVVGAFEGTVKILVNSSTKRIIGAHIVGAGASELIHELLTAYNAGIGYDDIAATIHAHPTLSEAVMEAAKALGGRAIHI